MPTKQTLWLCVLTLALTVPLATLAQGYHEVRELPEGLLGERISELIEVINANDRARAEAFFNDSVAGSFRAIAPMEQHLSIFADIYRSSQGLDFYGIRIYDGESPFEGTAVVVQNRLTEGWHGLVVAIEPEAPHRITGLQFTTARAPADLPMSSEKLSDQEIAAELEKFAKKLAEKDVFSGSVLLARNGKVLYQEAFGEASKRFNVANNIETKFNLGSMNKMFTGVAVMQLVEVGKLALNGKISTFVDESWLPKEITEKIEVRHLLSHTSGLGSYFNQTFMESSRARFRELEDYKPLIQGETLAFEPGTSWGYSNTGMLLLGVVIEGASGQNYFDYVRQKIAEPAGMKNTDCYDMSRPVPNLAIGYSHHDEGWTNNLYLHVMRGGPAGGGFSTAPDLLRFARALRGHKLLSESATRAVWSAKPELSSPEYGYGFATEGPESDRVVGHSGGFPGISSNLDIFLDSGFTAIVMSNYDRGGSPLQQKMRDLIAARAR